MNIARYWHTIKYWKAQQFFYRLWYPIKRYLVRPYRRSFSKREIPEIPNVAWPSSTQYDFYDASNNSFHLLNIAHAFADLPDWNIMDYGRLWQFHLHYFRWLNSNTHIERKLEMMHSFARYRGKEKEHSYPASIRLREWIIFFQKHQIKDPLLWQQLFRDVEQVAAYPEYEIQANHLLENGISLYWAGALLKNSSRKKQGTDLLLQQLKEQILPDGAHYELCPSYHLWITESLLHTIAVAEAIQDEQVITTLKQVLARMLGWAKSFCYPDGSFALIGDSVESAPSLQGLFEQAQKWDIQPSAIYMKESGFRKWKWGEAEILMKGDCKFPNYQPGHQHADALSFYIWTKQGQIVCDGGISTYDDNDTRRYQRSVAAHNTIYIDENNGYELWKSFRLGRRPLIKNIIDTADEFSNELNIPYKTPSGIQRKICIKEDILYICHTFNSKPNQTQTLQIHFHPNASIVKLNHSSWQVGPLIFELSGAQQWGIENYTYAWDYNRTRSSGKIKVVGRTLNPITLSIKHHYVN